METITAMEFDAIDGLDDWRALAWGAIAFFPTDSFNRSARFIRDVAAAADRVGHYPDVDLRPDGVTVRLFTVDVPGYTTKDVDLARAISQVADAHHLSAAPEAVQNVQLTVSTDDPARIMPFWRAALGYDVLGPTELIEPHRRNPVVWFHRVDRPVRGKSHIDVTVPREQAEARVRAMIDAGGTLVNDSEAPKWWVLADADGHIVDIETWPGSY